MPNMRWHLTLSAPRTRRNLAPNSSGQHLDLVGAFSMSMREADDEALRRARVFVDTEAACTERRRRGDRLGERRHRPGADRGRPAGALPRRRGTAEEITLFKSVGAAIEDLAAATLVWRKSGGAEP